MNYNDCLEKIIEILNDLQPNYDPKTVYDTLLEIMEEFNPANKYLPLNIDQELQENIKIKEEQRKIPKNNDVETMTPLEYKNFLYLQAQTQYAELNNIDLDEKELDKKDQKGINDLFIKLQLENSKTLNKNSSPFLSNNPVDLETNGVVKENWNKNKIRTLSRELKSIEKQIGFIEKQNENDNLSDNRIAANNALLDNLYLQLDEKKFELSELENASN